MSYCIISCIVLTSEHTTCRDRKNTSDGYHMASDKVYISQTVRKDIKSLDIGSHTCPWKVHNNCVFSCEVLHTINLLARI